MKPLLTLVFSVIAMSVSNAQTKDGQFLVDLLSANKDPRFRKVMDNPDKHHVQIIYTQIDRDAENKPQFTNYTFQLNADHYFNPASTVKLPAAILALEKLRTLPEGIDKDTWLQIDSAYAGQKQLLTEPTAPEKKPTMAHFIKQAMLISENEPYNRLYQFVGQEYFNKSLWQRGYSQTRITRRFEPNNEDQNRHTNPFRFLGARGETIYEQPMGVSNIVFDFPQLPLLGDAHYKDGVLVSEGIDFSRANSLPLFDLHQILQTVMFPESVPVEKRFKLSDEDYRFLYQYLSQAPGETNYPKYDGGDFYPTYAKFFFRDSTRLEQAGGLRVFNKVGWAYGFLTDASYVVDFDNQVEFMLAATVYVNEDGILNDNQYDYDELGYPFLYQLGQTIYQHELSRKRDFLPDLSGYKIEYEQQLRDERPTVKEKDVDN